MVTFISNINLSFMLYYTTLVLLIVNCTLLVVKHENFTQIIGVIVIFSSLLSFINIWSTSNHLPTSGKFETLQYIVLLVSTLGIAYNHYSKFKIKFFWFTCLFLQVYILTQDMTVSSDFFMYENPAVVLFFLFRITAMGVFSFALSNFFDCVFNLNSKKFISTISHRARNFVLLGAMIYLLGEFSGSYWCFLWWGDSWHWSKGFFLAGIMFLLSLLGSHLPKKIGENQRNKIVINILPLTIILTIFLLSH